MSADQKRVSNFVDEVQRQGLYSFDRLDLEKSLPISPESISKALHRLAGKHRVKRIRKGFYIILPVEYSAIGMIPPDWFIDDLMRYLQSPYYVGLLSAAALHGAAHQQVQQFQIVTPEQERPITLEGLSMRFFRKSTLATTPLQTVKGHSGMLPVSTPEATALDLIRYSRKIGGMDAVITILGELAESMSPEKLAKTAESGSEVSQLQRLGWLLDRLGKTTLANSLAKSPALQQPILRTKLDPAGIWGRFSAQNRWRVVENTQPESDL